MDFEQEERHFILDLMDFVYKLAGRPFEFNLQQMLNMFPEDKESFFSKDLTHAVLIHIADYRNSNTTLVNLTSPEYQSRIDTLARNYNPFELLKFLALYSWQSVSEYYNHKLLDAPMNFFDSIMRLLEALRRNGHCGCALWESLENVAKEVIATDLEKLKDQYPKFKKSDEDVDLTSEKELVLEAMRLVFKSYSVPFPEYLRRILDELLMKSQLEYDRGRLEAAVKIAMQDLEKNIRLLGDDKAIHEYYHKLSLSTFDARNFFEFCVCFTRRTVFQHVNMNDGSPRRAYDRFIAVLEFAKKEDQLIDVDDLMHGATQIIESDRERRIARMRTLDAAANTERIWEDFTNPRCRTKPDEENVVDSNTQRQIARTRPDSQNVADSDKHRQIANNGPDTNNVVASEENVISQQVQTALIISTSSGESGRPTSENGRPASEKAVTSSESTQRGSGSQHLIASGEHDNSCKCCKSRCTTT